MLFSPPAPGLAQGHLQRPGAHYTPTHLIHGFGSFLQRREAHDTEPFALPDFHHHFGSADGPEGRKLLLQLLIIHGVVQVFNIDGHLRGPALLFDSQPLESPPELRQPLDFLLRPPHVQDLAVQGLPVQVEHSLLRRLVRLVPNESEAFGLPAGVSDDLDALRWPVLTENALELLVVHLVAEVFHEHVGEGRSVPGPHLRGPLLGEFEAAHVHLTVVEPHAVHVPDGPVGGRRALEVHVGVALGAVVIAHHFAGQDVPKCREQVEKGPVVYGFVQVFDEYVSNSGLPQAVIGLRPHEAERFAIDQIKVHGVQGPLGVRGEAEIDVAIAQGTAGLGVTADSGEAQGASRPELFIKHVLGHICVQVAHVQGGLEVLLLLAGRIGLPAAHLSERREEAVLGERAMLSQSYGPSSCSHTETANSRLSNTVEAEKMKFRNNTWSAGSEQTHQTKGHPSKESLPPKGLQICTLSDLKSPAKASRSNAVSLLLLNRKKASSRLPDCLHLPLQIEASRPVFCINTGLELLSAANRINKGQGPSVYSSAGRRAGRQRAPRSRRPLRALGVPRKGTPGTWRAGPAGCTRRIGQKHRHTDTRAGARRPPRYPRRPLGTDRVTHADFGSPRLAAGPEGLTGRSALGRLRREAVPDRCGAESAARGRGAAGGRWGGRARTDGRTDRPRGEEPVAVVGRGARKPGTLLKKRHRKIKKKLTRSLARFTHLWDFSFFFLLF